MNILHNRLHILYLALLILILNRSLATVSAQSAVPETLSIAFIGASSGAQANRDQQLYNAAVLAASQINSSDNDDEIGFLSEDDTRYDLEIVYYGADTADSALSAYNEAVDDGAIAVLGPQTTSFAETIVDEADLDVPLLLAAVDSPMANTVYHLAPTDDMLAQAAADYLVNERHITQIALVAANTEEALAGADTFRETVEDVDEDILVTDLTHAADEQDFASDAQTIRDSKAQALFAWTLDSQMIALLDALDEVGWEGTVVYAGLDADFLSRADSAVTTNLYGPVGWSTTAYNAASEAFINAYAEQYADQTVADSASAYYYDAVYMIAEAVTSSGSEPSDVVSGLNSLSYEGAAGSYIGGETSSLLLLQATTDASLIEAARYSEGACTTCSDTWLVDNSDTEADGSASYDIGLIVSVDGANTATGESIEQAARLAVREVNEVGGVIGDDGVRYSLNLRLYEATNSDETAVAIEQAVSDGVEILLGPDFNGQILTNLFSAEGAGLLQLVSATSPQISSSEASNYVFQLRSNDEALVEATASYLLNVRELTTFATVAVRTDYGLDAVNSFNDVIADDDDARINLRLEHDIDETDFSEFANQIAASAAQAVVILSTQPAATALIDALEGINWDGLVVYGYLTPDFATSVSDSSLEVIGPVTWWSTAADSISRDFVERYTTRYGISPTPQSAAYYDAVYLIASGLEEIGMTSSEMQSWLLDLDQFTGVQGSYESSSFANGELTRMVYLLGIQEGVVSEVARYNGTTCVMHCQ